MVSGPDGLVTIRRALLSVDDPTGLIELARALARHGAELVATERTRARLVDGELPARAAEELTGIGAWFSGRIKTLHPGLLGGILAPRTEAGTAELESRGLLPIDLVAVNFYPFARRLSEAPAAADLEEFIDVGGVTLARAAAKNHAGVAVLTSPDEYGPVILELDRHRGALTAATRLSLASAAYRRTAAYDALIARGIARRAEGPEKKFPEALRLQKEPLHLRYGENPHQAASAYRFAAEGAPVEPPPDLTLIKGEALSFTNLLDVDTALSVVGEFPTPSAAVVKHATPVGVASGATVGEALKGAFATDAVARYGCVVAVNRPLLRADTDTLHGIFVDLLAAPSIEPGAREALSRRTKLKLLETPAPTAAGERWEVHTALGRVLVQESDRRPLGPEDFRLVTSRKASSAETDSLAFAWRVVRHSKSNAIVLANGSRTVGIGSGQPTRVKAVELAVEVAGDRARGSVLASDAFFPFADGIEAAGKAGVSAILQPGGSVRDEEVIAAAERWKIAMYFTGWRVFRH